MSKEHTISTFTEMCLQGMAWIEDYKLNGQCIEDVMPKQVESFWKAVDSNDLTGVRHFFDFLQSFTRME